MVEPIRLVIWDLDETFWRGTLTEGGIIYRQDAHDMVVELAQRGIPSAICSKNDIEPVRDILSAHAIWNYFVFPSIDWTSKGPRLRALVDALQLRPETVAFIDDNPLNRAEAAYFVPGLRTFSEVVIPTLLDDPLLRGKPDPELARLRQYRLLQERQAARAQSGDTDAFLRESNIRVSIDYDVEAKLDRAIELINRTNQLNFTKSRLPEVAEMARAELRDQLNSMYMKAGLVSVRDRYGDHGVCGLYMMYQRHGHPARLVQFCFSCRILNMGVESWVYRLLGRPRIDVAEPVLADIVHDTREMTWINRAPAGGADDHTASRLAYVLFRGGCDIDAVAHYFHHGCQLRRTRAARGEGRAGTLHFALDHAETRDPGRLRRFAEGGPPVRLQRRGLHLRHGRSTGGYNARRLGTQLHPRQPDDAVPLSRNRRAAAHPLLQVTAPPAKLYRPGPAGDRDHEARARPPGNTFRLRRHDPG